MGDLGISTTLSNKITFFLETKNFKEANRWLINCWIILTIFSGIIFCSLFLFFIFFQKSKFKIILSNELLVSLFLILLYVLILLQTNLLSGIYTASLKFTKQKNIDSLAKILEFVFIITILTLNGKVIQVSAGMLFCRFIILAYILYDLAYNYKWINPNLLLIKKSSIKELLKPALGNMFLNIGYLMYYNGPIILIGSFLGSTYVARFFALSTILKVVKQLPLLINLPLYPEYARLLQFNEIQTAKTLHKSAILSTFIIAFISIVITYTTANQLIGLLLYNKKIEIISPFFEISLFSLLIQCTWHSSSAVLVGGNKHIKLAVHFFLASILGYIVIILFIEKFTLTAIACGLLIIDILMIISTFRQVFKLLDEKFLNLFQIGNLYNLIIQTKNSN
ncbi:hypothetical protein [Runella aurantiaca]|uniref:Lipopolysaccharide biosynthesis protein n=1 Tax=Runella aurantiaca TaxID=2282308 RepID=A0A369I9I6_9BACT|nr:hypothetical protein [Runella aurantiaca]RDB06278.1 hypothetical protein DVG78_08415 [Runella aurantiaca]